MKRCPKCGCETFYATAHVTQDWLMDKHGNWIKTVSDCEEVKFFPDDMDLWECMDCGYTAAGSKFNVNIYDTTE